MSTETPSNTYLPLQGLTFSDNRLPGGHACLPHKQESLGICGLLGIHLGSGTKSTTLTHLPTVSQQPGHCSCIGVGSADGGSPEGGYYSVSPEPLRVTGVLRPRRGALSPLGKNLALEACRPAFEQVPSPAATQVWLVVELLHCSHV